MWVRTAWKGANSLGFASQLNSQKRERDGQSLSCRGRRRRAAEGVIECEMLCGVGAMCWSWEELCYLTGLAGRLRSWCCPRSSGGADGRSLFWFGADSPRSGLML